jgi:hypothetical protein
MMMMTMFSCLCRWECLFQPISNCTVSSVEQVAAHIVTTKSADDGVDITQEEKEELTAFLSRPSDFALKEASDIRTRLNIQDWESDHIRTAGIHIRQQSHSDGQDWVRKSSHKWTPQDLLHVLLQISRLANVTNFIVVSDDPQLASLTAQLSTSRNEAIKIVFTTDLVTHATRSDQDCVRDNLGCEKNLGVSRSAYSVMADIAIISRTNVFAGT